MQHEVGQVREVEAEQVLRGAGHHEVRHVGRQDRRRQDRRRDAHGQHGSGPPRPAGRQPESIAERQRHRYIRAIRPRFDGITKAMRKLSITSPAMKRP